MTKFGFSIYPEKHELGKVKAYMDLLKSYGACRIFMSLLQLEAGDEAVFDKYKEIIAYANQLDLAVIADVSPHFIQQHGWEGQLIEKAHEFGLAGIRLDEALSLDEIVAVTKNPYQIKIELNMSAGTELLSQLLETDCQRDNIIGCHNFYPHEFTGLSLDFFLEMSAFYKEHGIETAAFVSAQTADEGPWPLSEGLPTLEDFRHLDMASQVQLFKAFGSIDNILISNQFLTEEELKALTEALAYEQKVFEVEITEELLPIEEEIIHFDHNYRGDISPYVIRSTWPRVVYKDASIPPRQQDKRVSRGSIIMDNDLYTRYKGEIHIALKDFTLSDKANVLGRLTPGSLWLLDYLMPWEDFKLKIKA